MTIDFKFNSVKNTNLILYHWCVLQEVLAHTTHFQDITTLEHFNALLLLFLRHVLFDCSVNTQLMKGWRGRGRMGNLPVTNGFGDDFFWRAECVHLYSVLLLLLRHIHNPQTYKKAITCNSTNNKWRHITSTVQTSTETHPRWQCEEVDREKNADRVGNNTTLRLPRPQIDYRQTMLSSKLHSLKHLVNNVGRSSHRCSSVSCTTSAKFFRA